MGSKGTVTTKGDQGMAANGPQLGKIDDIYYFDNRKGFEVLTKVKWNKTVEQDPIKFALNVKRDHE